MIERMLKKLEGARRMQELAPQDTLIRAGLKEKMIVADVGAGTGLFSFAAAQISQDTVYAVEIEPDLIGLLEKRKRDFGFERVVACQVEDECLPLEDDSVDLALLITVLHELEDRGKSLGEIKRVLKDNGKLLIVEFYKRETPMGPPLEERLSEKEVEALLQEYGLSLKDRFSLGENFYALVFQSVNSR